MSLVRFVFVGCFMSTLVVAVPAMAKGESDDGLVASGGGCSSEGDDNALALSLVAGLSVAVRGKRKS